MFPKFSGPTSNGVKNNLTHKKLQFYIHFILQILSSTITTNVHSRIFNILRKESIPYNITSTPNSETCIKLYAFAQKCVTLSITKQKFLSPTQYQRGTKGICLPKAEDELCRSCILSSSTSYFFCTSILV